MVVFSVAFRRFAVTIATGPFSEMVAVFCSAKGEVGNCVNPPFPSPLKAEIVLSPLFVTAKSRLPSPLKSATTTALGLVPTAYGEPLASVNVPSPLPSRTVTLFEVELAMTRSMGATVTPEELMTVLPKAADAIATGAVSVLARGKGDLACWTKLPLS